MELVEDEEAPEVLRSCSMLLLGADTVFRDGSIVNRAGSRRLAEIAHDLQVPTVVAAETLKLAPVPASQARGLDGEAGALFEIVEARLIHEVVTDDGTFAADSLAPLVDRTPLLAAGWDLVAAPGRRSAKGRSASTTRSTSGSPMRVWNGSASARRKQASAPGNSPWPAYAASRWSAYVPICASMPCGAQRGQRLVPAVERDDVRLPPVRVAGRRRRRLDEAGEPLLVEARDALARGQQLRQPAQLRQPERAQHVREAVVRARRADLEVAARLDPVVAQPPDAVGDLLRVGGHGAAFTRRHDLAGVEREAAERAERAARPALRAGAERAGGILDERDALRHVRGQRVPVERPSEEVHREHRARARADGGRRTLEVEVHRRRVDVHEDRRRAGERDDVRRGREGVRGHEHLVARSDAESEHTQVERGRAGRDGDGVLDPAGARELVLELGDLRPHGQLTGGEHLRHGGELLVADVRAGEADRVGGLRLGAHAAASCVSRYQAIVRASPSSSSTFASKPSSSRAFSTFGMRISTSA